MRWSRLRRDGYPLSFAIEALQGFFLPFGVALFLSAAGAVPAMVPIALPFVWFAAEVVLARIARWPCSPRGIVAMVVRDALLPAVWIATWFGRRVVWHGTTIAPNRPG